MASRYVAFRRRCLRRCDARWSARTDDSCFHISRTDWLSIRVRRWSLRMFWRARATRRRRSRPRPRPRLWRRIRSVARLNPVCRRQVRFSARFRRRLGRCLAHHPRLGRRRCSHPRVRCLARARQEARLEALRRPLWTMMKTMNRRDQVHRVTRRMNRRRMIKSTWLCA